VRYQYRRECTPCLALRITTPCHCALPRHTADDTRLDLPALLELSAALPAGVYVRGWFQGRTPAGTELVEWIDASVVQKLLAPGEGGQLTAICGHPWLSTLIPMAIAPDFREAYADLPFDCTVMSIGGAPGRGPPASARVLCRRPRVYRRLGFTDGAASAAARRIGSGGGGARASAQSGRGGRGGGPAAPELVHVTATLRLKSAVWWSCGEAAAGTDASSCNTTGHPPPSLNGAQITLLQATQWLMVGIADARVTAAVADDGAVQVPLTGGASLASVASVSGAAPGRLMALHLHLWLPQHQSCSSLPPIALSSAQAAAVMSRSGDYGGGSGDGGRTAAVTGYPGWRVAVVDAPLLLHALLPATSSVTDTQRELATSLLRVMPAAVLDAAGRAPLVADPVVLPSRSIWAAAPTCQGTEGPAIPFIPLVLQAGQAAPADSTAALTWHGIPLVRCAGAAAGVAEEAQPQASQADAAADRAGMVAALLRLAPPNGDTEGVHASASAASGQRRLGATSPTETAATTVPPASGAADSALRRRRQMDPVGKHGQSVVADVLPAAAGSRTVIIAAAAAALLLGGGLVTFAISLLLRRGYDADDPAVPDE
jgi:hypothetical protein